MNCLVLQWQRERLIIDCGVTFADGALGAEVIRPDFQFLASDPQARTSVVLTHGHEDHIGAVPYLLQEQGPLPIYGPAHALALVGERLAESACPAPTRLVQTPAGERYRIGPFTIEPVRVTHSIADATALAIDTPVGRVIHTGDFKIDPSPEAPEQFDAERFRQLGDEGVRLLLSDSTNADVERTAGAERDVGEALLQYARSAPERLVVAMFASNTHRLGAMLRAARLSGRRVCLVGRSMRTHLRVAASLGRLQESDDLLVSPQQAAVMPRNQVLIAATGTQAEAAAGLARLARGSHPQLRLGAGDTVVMSSRVIPGHERQVWGLMDSMRRAGLFVVDGRSDPSVHTSGHAYRDEQRRMLALTRPEWFIPVHGTYSHLTSHAALASEHSQARPLVLENGDVAELSHDGLRWADRVPTGRVHLHDGAHVPDQVLRDRSRLARFGIVMASVSLREGLLAGPVALLTRGVVVEDDHADLLDAARKELTRALRRATEAGHDDDDRLCSEARRSLGRFFQRHLGLKVPSYILITRLDDP